MLIRKYHKLMGKAKEYSSDSPAAGTRFLQRPIFVLAGFCSWDLFRGGLSGLGCTHGGEPHMFVSTVSSCFEPRLLISLSDHSLSPFSRSPSRAWSPQGVPQFSDRCVGMAIRRFPPLLFLLPCRFHVFALLFG